MNSCEDVSSMNSSSVLFSFLIFSSLIFLFLPLLHSRKLNYLGMVWPKSKLVGLDQKSCKVPSSPFPSLHGKLVLNSEFFYSFYQDHAGKHICMYKRLATHFTDIWTVHLQSFHSWNERLDKFISAFIKRKYNQRKIIIPAHSRVIESTRIESYEDWIY